MELSSCMRISSINSNLSYRGLLSGFSVKRGVIKGTTLGLALCASSLMQSSCYIISEPPKPNESKITTPNVRYNDDIILPDTVNQTTIQGIQDIHQRNM